MAVAERSRELAFLLDSLGGVRPCKRMSQRQIIEAALLGLRIEFASAGRTPPPPVRSAKAWRELIQQMARVQP